MTDITGTDGIDTLAGTAGDDSISALGGNDTIRLGAGRDTINGGPGTDQLTGTTADFLSWDSRSLTITANTISGGALNTRFSNIERISISDNMGGGGGLTLDASGFTGGSVSVAVGDGGNLTGSAGSDSFNLYYAASAVIDGGAGTDSLIAAVRSERDDPLVITRLGGIARLEGIGHAIEAQNVESLTIYAEGIYAGDALFADASQFDARVTFMGTWQGGTPRGAVVTGGSAGDSFQNFGADAVLTGGGGIDSYRFSLDIYGEATILDFAAEESIAFTSSGATPSFIGTGAFTGVAGQYRYYSWLGQTLIVADVDGDRRGDSTFTLASGAFVLGETVAGSNTLRIVGTAPAPDPADNAITGTAGNDVIESGAGQDEVLGLGGNDLVNGGDDDDTIDGGVGNDELHGGAGDDVLDGGYGEDILRGEDGNDTLTATGYDDADDADWFYGGAGDDTLIGLGRDHHMFGEDGNDLITLTGGSVVAFDSQLSGGAGDDVIVASGAGELRVEGGDGDDDITIADTTSGDVDLGAGDDVLHLDAGNFELTLGSVWNRGGRDTVVMTDTGSGFIAIYGFAAGEQGDRLDLSIYGADPFADGTLGIGTDGVNVSIIHSASGMQYWLQGVSVANLSAYNLGAANPRYAPEGLTLNDAYAGSPDVDSPGELVGADGDDTIHGFGGDDVLFGSGGKDLLEGGAGDDVLSGGTGNNILRGGDGVDTVDYGDAAAAVTVNLARAAAQNTGGAGSDTLVGVENAAGSAFGDLLTGNGFANAIAGEAGNDRLLGGAGDDTLGGGDGDDVLIGGIGADEMRGGAGDDVYYLDSAADTVIETVNAGWDVVRAGVDYTLTANVEELFIGGAARNGSGNALANTLHGSGSNNVLLGLGGDDIIRGGGGRDTIDGGDGADLLDGGVGKDTLTGGAARDVFQFRDGDFGTSRSLADVITDFSHADAEKIHLSLVDANVNAGGNQAFAFIGNGAFTGVAGQLHYAQAGGNTYVEGDTNGDGLADFVVALTGLHSLVAGDFVL